MFLKSSLKPSAQSLQARGLPPWLNTPITAISAMSSESDTEKRIASLNEGLNKCSSILNMLVPKENPSLVKKKRNPAQRVKIVSPKKTHKDQTHTKVKNAPYNKRLVSSTPTSGSHQQTSTQKKNKKKQSSDIKEILHHEQVLCKDDMMSSNTIEELIDERNRLREYLEQVSSKKALVEAEFSQVLTSTTAKESQPIDQDDKLSRCIKPEKPYEEKTKVVAVESKRSTLEDLMKSISEKLTVTNDTFSKLDICIETHSKDSLITAGNQASNKASLSPKQTPKSILRNATRTPARDVEKKDQGDQSILMTNEHRRDKTSEKGCCSVKFQQQEVQVMRAETQVVTLKYLIKELFKSLGDHRNIELDNLLLEIDHQVNSLPFILSNLNSDAITDLQYLKKENSQMKRRYEEQNNQLILQRNEHATEIESLKANFRKKAEETDRQLLQGTSRQQALHSQVNDVCKVTEDLRAENKRLLTMLSEQDVKSSNEKQELKNTISQLSNELETSDNKNAELKLQLQTREKEMQILQISSNQKDAEIERLSNLNKDFQSSIANLLEDIEAERVKHASKQKKQRAMSFDKLSIEKIKNLEKPCQKRMNVAESDLIIHPRFSTPSISSLSMNTNTNSTNLSSFNTNSSVSTLKTYDNIEFQNDLIHLETKIDVVKNALSQQKNMHPHT